MSEIWRDERVYFNGDAYFDALIDAISEAATRIEMETYIFYPDEMGRRIEAALAAAAKRGVRVRLLVDGIGALSWIGNWQAGFLESGVEVRIWNPFYVGPFLKRVAGAMVRGGLSRVFTRANRRTHRKYTIIDGQRAFVGSLNVSADHVAKYRGERAWRDTGVDVSGPAVAKLAQAFVHGWDRAYTLSGARRWIGRHRLPVLTADSLVRLNFTRRFRRRFRRDLIQRIRRSTTRVWITNPYLAPTGPLLKALLVAANRRIDVRLLVPARSDVFFMRWVASTFYGALLETGVRIFEYQPSFLHAKTVVIDDWVIVGTSNLNTRSFLHDLEVDIVLTGAESKARVETQYVRDLELSHEILRENLRNQRLLQILGRLVRAIARSWL